MFRKIDGRLLMLRRTAKACRCVEKNEKYNKVKENNAEHMQRRLWRHHVTTKINGVVPRRR